MKEFCISERYRLEIRWMLTRYKDPEVAELCGCYLTGPVVSQINKMNPNDFIDLDFINQYTVLVNNFYIARLSWGEVKHFPLANKIILEDAKLTNKNINVVPKLQYNDYIVVNTENHTEAKHYKFLTYPAYLLNGDGTLYNFSRSQ